MIFLIWLMLVLVMVLTLYYRQVYSRFSSKKVNHMPVIPQLGNMAKLTYRLENLSDLVHDTYKSFPKDRFVGHYEFVKPVVMIRDLELIKQICIKDFESFLDHRAVVHEETDQYFGSNLYSLKGQKWKDMRATLSPAFTSCKIKLMVPFMMEVGNQMIKSLKTKFQKERTEYLDIDIKDMSTRYANDVIASCVFGLKIDSFKDENNEFYAMGNAASNFTPMQLLKIFGYACIPSVMRKFKVKMFSDEIGQFFTNLVLNTMKNRVDNNIIRQDIINILMQAMKDTMIHDYKIAEEAAGNVTIKESSVGDASINRTWSYADIIAQAVVFFIAGFDSVATVMTFLLYELALNRDCQDKLSEEIMEMERKIGGFDFNGIQQMKYLDMLVSETLRKWPSAITADRIATKPYNLGKANRNATEDFIVQKGEGIWIPIWAIHHDPKYYENPEKFDPERFSDENKHKIKPFTYMPFGTGPRNCIGSRFALCEVKVMVYQLIQHMEVSPSENTCIPAKLSTDSFNLRLKGGHSLEIRPRNKVQL